MARRPNSSSRKHIPSHWLANVRKLSPVDVGILIVGGLLAALSFSVAIGIAASGVNPGLAIRLMPYNAKALAKSASLAVQEQPDRKAGAEIRALAIRSLIRSPLNPEAVRNLAIVSDLEGDYARADRLMRSAESLSKRDLLTQLWLIERDVASDNVASALSRYDIALRANPSSTTLLFPPLSGALIENEIQSGFAELVKSEPGWLPSFIDFSIENGRNVSGLANALALARGRHWKPETVAAQERLIRALVAARAYKSAEKLFRAMPESSPARLKDVSFARTNIGKGSPFFWILMEGEGYATFSSASQLLVSATHDAKGVLAEKLVMLPTGRYIFRTAPATADMDHERLNWSLVCLLQAGDREITLDSLRVRRSHTEFEIMSDCEAVRIRLFLDRSSGKGDGEVSVNAPSLHAI